MRAMILAAGYGTRMRPLTLTTPKPLLNAGGKSLIVHHIERLKLAGIDELVINTGWLGDKLEQSLGTGSQWQVSIEYSREGEPLETAGGIRNALPLLGDEPFLVVNGDIWCDVSFTRLAQAQLAENSLAHLLLVDNPKHNPQGDFSLSGSQGNLLVGNDGAKLTFSGIGLYRPALFALDSQEAKLGKLLRQAIRRQAVTGEHFNGQWWDIGTPQRLEQLNAFLARETE